MSRYRGREAALRHIEDYRELEKRLGPILGDVRGVFFSLSKQDLVGLLSEYRKRYGDSAFNYAAETYQLWKTGRRKMSGQTAERLLNLIPPRLSSSKRYELVEKLCNHHRKITRHEVYIDPSDSGPGLSQLRQLVINSSTSETIRYIPSDVLEVITWLNNESVTATRALLAQIDKARHATLSQLAEKEIRTTTCLVRDDSAQSATHTIILPTSKIIVKIQRPQVGLISRIIKSIFGG